MRAACWIFESLLSLEIRGRSVRSVAGEQVHREQDSLNHVGDYRDARLIPEKRLPEAENQDDEHELADTSYRQS